jgi:hypothetical protein
VQPEAFQPPDTQLALRRGLIFGGLGLLAVVLPALAISQTELADGALQDIWERAQLGPLLLSWALVPIAFYLLGLRWRALIPAPHTPPGSGLAAILAAGLLINTALPGPVGEFGAAWFAHKRYRVPLPLALASGIGARLVGVWMAASAAVLAWIFSDLQTPDGWQDTIGMVAGLIGATGVGLGLMVLQPQLMRRVSARTLGRGGSGRLGRLLVSADGMVAQITTAQVALRAQGGRAYFACFMWSMLAHLVVLSGIAIAILSVGATLSLPGLLFTYAATTAGVIVMFALPGSQIGWDALFLGLLVTTAGLSTPDALLITVVVRVQQLSVMVGGAVALTWLVRSNTSPPA